MSRGQSAWVPVYAAGAGERRRWLARKEGRKYTWSPPNRVFLKLRLVGVPQRIDRLADGPPLHRRNV